MYKLVTLRVYFTCISMVFVFVKEEARLPEKVSEIGVRVANGWFWIQ